MNKVVEECISKRCEEILNNDQKYININNSILEMESIFKGTLTDKQKKYYNQIEEKVMGSITYATIQIYKKCIEDMKVTPP